MFVAVEVLCDTQLEKSKNRPWGRGSFSADVAITATAVSPVSCILSYGRYDADVDWTPLPPKKKKRKKGGMRYGMRCVISFVVVRCRVMEEMVSS